jgi:PAS domain S-box-containing protein
VAEAPERLHLAVETLTRADLFPADAGLPGIVPENGHSESLFRQVLEALPVAIYMTDAEGVITFYNEAAVELWGRRPAVGDERWCGSWKLFWPDGRPMPHDQCPMAIALSEARPVYGMEAVAERPDGTRVPFIPFPTPLFDRSGVLTGAVNLLVDATDRKRAEDYERRLAAIIEFSDDAILSKDLNGVIATWNRGAERLFGYTAAEAIGRPITMLIPPERIDEEPSILERIRRGERIEHYETIRQRKDGSLVDISLTVSPIRNSDGRIIGASKIARDISERKRAEEKQNILFAEMRHRIKNTIAMAQVFATHTLQSAPPEEQEAFVGRLRSLSAAQDVLTARSWSRAPLREVVVRGLAAFQESYAGRLAIDGPDDIWLDADKVLSLTLALHELATNAAKYGAWSNETGTVAVSWEMIAGGEAPSVRFIWRESGGPEVVPPERRGFGSRLVERTFGECVRLDFNPEGVLCVFETTVA